MLKYCHAQAGLWSPPYGHKAFGLPSFILALDQISMIDPGALLVPPLVWVEKTTPRAVARRAIFPKNLGQMCPRPTINHTRIMLVNEGVARLCSLR